jgi:hypothetical protein
MGLILAGGRSRRRRRFVAVLLLAAVLRPAGVRAESIAVARAEGLTHGFLALRTLDGATLADGDQFEIARGSQVTVRLVFHFKDGSLHDETAVYTQRGRFRLVSDHLVQKGPAFKMPLEATINARNGRVSVRYTDKDGEEKAIEERLDLPADLANGMILALLKNVSPKTPKTTVSMLAITPKPRLVKLEFIPSGEDPFSTGGVARKAMHYVVKVDIPGLTGVVATILEKTPPDSSVWILEGEAPAFVKSESQLFNGGPLWRIELVSPEWPAGAGSAPGVK